jgi:hypothetical protein
MKAVNWDWLSGHPVLLLGFIMLVLGVPPTLAANWQIVQSAARRMRRLQFKRRRPDEATLLIALSNQLEQVRRAYGISPQTQPFLSAPPVMLRPDYRYDGGAVPTSAVMSTGHAVVTPPDCDHVPSLSTIFGSSTTAPGTAATR